MAADDPAGRLSDRAARFDAEAYARATAHHRAFDDVVLAPLRLGAGDRVVDLGCGTGDLTARLAALVDAGGPDGGTVLGVDASPSCARRTSAHLAEAGHGAAAVAATAQSLGALLPAASVDAVVSVATLHWVPEQDQPDVLAGIRRVLRPGGTLRADLGGRGQVAAARAVLAGWARSARMPLSPWFFPDERRYTELLAGAGLRPLEVVRVRQRRALRDERAMTDWLVSQVLPAYLRHAPADRHDELVREAVVLARDGLRRADGSYDQDYVRLLVLATSPGPVAGHEYGPGHAEAADQMAAVHTLLQAGLANGSLDESTHALWHKRSRQAMKVAQQDPERGQALLSTLGEDLASVLQRG